MAKAKVYFRFNGNNAGWQGPYGEGSSQQSQGHGAENHAERQAWREAQKKLREFYDTNKANFSGDVEVKIWVDQLVCPQCQLWMIAGVLRNLASFEFKPKLFVEVKTGNKTNSMEVTREAVWSVDIGHAGVETLTLLKQKNVTIRD